MLFLYSFHTHSSESSFDPNPRLVLVPVTLLTFLAVSSPLIVFISLCLSLCTMFDRYCYTYKRMYTCLMYKCAYFIGRRFVIDAYYISTRSALTNTHCDGTLDYTCSCKQGRQQTVRRPNHGHHKTTWPGV